jgi:aryl-alcohol dehydrogenase-like predicted oxidoreductase
MRYKLLGNSGLRVSELALGTMTFGEDWDLGTSKRESQDMFNLFVEAGGNFIDTANFYTDGSSEAFLGEFIKPVREQIVLGTKYTLTNRSTDPNGGGNHRKNLVQSVEGSLKRLQTDYIDLLWLHAWDFLTPVEEVMRALDDLIRAGKVLYVGISDTPAWIISQANTLAALRGWTPFIGLQIEYSLLQRAPERDLLPMAKAFDIGVTAWGPIAAGALTGKYIHQSENSELRRLPANSPLLKDKNREIAEVVLEIAAETGKSPAQVAINWVRQQSNQIIPIVGARKATQLKDNLDSLTFSLSEEHLKKLDETSKIELGFPHDFLVSDHVRTVIHGETFSLIDNHRKSYFR